ncbi:lysine-specific demethylase 4A-like [Sinocyclocheilus grahami]|uniref:lysine-specific demethylase 4A-like n=1 Tax=Sinocyclocheilus grahami TaxID=75366 RepID=UPI0007ACBE79|nr:PREDICTED: lysine-specific demethylase 4A-like [Sinocyclocheilus grahami]
MASDMPVSRGIMTFYPTIEEFKNFNRYIAYMESQGAHKAGLAKIVPPKNWKPRRSYDDIDDLLIPAPIQQVVTGQSGLFTQYNIQKKAMTVKEFRKTANSDKFCSPRYDDFEELERKYWKNLTFNPPIYGADVNGTLYDPDVKEWNVGHLNTILDTVEHHSGITIEGVNTPYLYFGMWKTTFAWHTEDMDLYSINYLHFGEPKSWYCVPPEHGKRLERLAKGFFPGSSQNCEAFLRHKMTLISPSILKKYGIPFEKITQEAGEFMITFPYGYHAGFNHGFNCAESTNFATRRWIDYGKQAIMCSCRKDMVKISMDVFVRKFQPERYELWLAGKDNAPIDHSKPTPEAAEFLGGEAEKSGAQELCFENQSSEGQKKSLAKQRIGTKRHRVCLDLPEEVLPKSETNDEEAEYGKKSRLTTYTEQCREYPELKDEDDLLPLTGSTSLKMLPGSRSTASREHVREACLSAANPSSASTQSFPKRHLSIASVPTVPHCLSAVPRISTKPGVASLLFHRTLSPSDALQVHSYAARTALHKPQQPSTEKPREDLNEPDIKPDVRPNTPQPNTKLEIEGEKENKSMKRKLQPLSKLPRFHPLLRESSSDDEIQEPAAEPEETDPWARLLAPMWQSKQRNFRVEKDFNFCMGQQPPYCAVCTLFHTYTESDVISLSQSSSAAEGDKRRTKPLIPEMCFTSSSEGHLSTPNVEEDGTSQLVSCSVCSVRVHTTEKCQFCRKWVKKSTGCCVQCSHGRCSTSFHPSCAQAAGVQMHPDDWPFVVYFTCWRHKGGIQIEQRNKASMRELEKGQKVISKHRNGRYYHCEVVELTKATFYEVIFDDGSFSDNLFPEDIVNRDCRQLGPPSEGDVVQVRWTDGLIYGAKFVSDHIIPMYQVEFEDDSQLTVKREDVYSLNEVLPKRVKARLSVASDMRFKGVFVEKEVKQDSKRQRVINSRYREDYIEPVIYRSIME